MDSKAAVKAHQMFLRERRANYGPMTKNQGKMRRTTGEILGTTQESPPAATVGSFSGGYGAKAARKQSAGRYFGDLMSNVSSTEKAPPKKRKDFLGAILAKI